MIDNVVHQPVFFGPRQTPLFGVLTTPASNEIRGTVLVAPSLGKEQAETTRGLRLLAALLANVGFAVLRSDYLYTGESWGAQDDPAALEGWLASFRLGAEYLCGLGAGAPALVAHRLGALLAAQETALLQELSAVVLWDPVRKGSQFIRAKKAVYRMISEDDGSVPGPRPLPMTEADDGRVHLAGQFLEAGVADRLGAMRLQPETLAGWLPAKSAVLVTDSERAYYSALDAGGTEVQRFGNQEPFLAPTHPSFLTLPISENSYIVNWLDRNMPQQTIPIRRRDPAEPVSGIVGHTRDGRPIETAVTTLDDGTVVWDTAIVGKRETATKVFVSYSLGQYIRTGPSRLWEETALAVAERGGRGLRFDRPGVGEAGVDQASDSELTLYTADYVHRGLALTEMLSRLPVGSLVAHAGICIGAWSSEHGALELTERNARSIRSAVVLVNPLMWRLAPQNKRLSSALSAEIDLAGKEQEESPRAFTKKVYQKLNWLGSQAAPKIRRRFPKPLHTVIGQLPFIQMPEVVLRRLERHGIRVRLVFSPLDNAHFVTFVGGDDAMQRVGPGVRRRVAGLGDHTAYHRLMRDAAMDECLDVLGLPALPPVEAAPPARSRFGSRVADTASAS